MQDDKTKTAPIWQPFTNKLFLAVWLATLVSNIGTWMNDVGASWLMVSTTKSPVMVSLVQTATSLPVMLLAIPAGALALLLCTYHGYTTDKILVVFTFLLGCGTAMSMPVWAAITPELVTKKELHAAITLNGLGVNVSRAIGPAIAGYLISMYGVPSVFLVNSLSFLGVIVVVAAWKRPPKTGGLPAERCWTAMRSGLRYARYSDMFNSILFKGIGFFFFASSLWAMLPILVNQRLQAGSSTYGLLMACLGLGAIAFALALPRIRLRIRSDNLVRVATLAYACALVILAAFTQFLYLAAAMVLAGAGWIGVMSSLQVAAQGSLPDWVRARGLSVFMMVFMGSMAIGSLVWGYLAKLHGIETCFLLAAAGLALGILATWSFNIGGHETVDLTPSLHWPLPVIDQSPQHDQGPVLVTIEYRVASDKLEIFHRLMRELKLIRKRDGAYFWELFQDTAQSDRYIECFMTESWLEHLRQHDRVSKSDRVLQEDIGNCLIDGEEKRINHYVASSISAQGK